MPRYKKVVIKNFTLSCTEEMIPDASSVNVQNLSMSLVRKQQVVQYCSVEIGIGDCEEDEIDGIKEIEDW